MSQVITENLRPGGFIHGADATFHGQRDAGVIKSGSGKLVAGTVLASLILAASATATAGANTGNGTLTPDASTPVLAGAKDGKYTLKCITGGANAVFRVFDPGGAVLGDYTIGGAAFSDQIKFAMASGATPFAAGDTFVVNVANISKVYVPYDETATDGSQVAAGVLYAYTDATSANVAQTVVARDCPVIISMLAFKTGATSAGMEQAYEQLTRLGIIPR